MERRKQKTCVVCKQRFSGRPNAKTCSARCRKRLQRAKDLLADETFHIKQTAKRVEASAERALKRLESRVATETGEAGFVEVSSANSPKPPLPLPTSQPPAGFPDLSSPPTESLDTPGAIQSTSAASPSLEVGERVGTVFSPVAIAPSDQVPNATGTPPPQPGTLESPQREVVGTPFGRDANEISPSAVPRLEQGPILANAPVPELPKSRRFKYLLPPGARFAVASILVISLVAIGTYLLGNQSAQNGNKSSAAANGQAFSSSSALPTDSSATSIHLNKATFIDNSQSLTASGQVTIQDVNNLNPALKIAGNVATNGNIDISGRYQVNGIALSSGNLSDSPQITLKGNTFNSPAELVQLTDTGLLPALSGSNLTNLDASQLGSGTVNDARLSANVTLQGDSFNGPNELVKTNGAGQIPTSNLPSDLAYIDGNQTFTGVNSFSNAGNIFVGDGSGVTNLNASNIVSGTLSDNRLTNNVALLNRNGQTFTGSNTLSGSTTQTGSYLFQSATNSLNAFQIQNQAGNDNLLIADTINTRLGIGVASPNYTLDVNGDVNIASGQAYRINGAVVCSNVGCTPSGGSSSYIQLQANTPGTQQTGSGNISGTFIAGFLQGNGIGVTNLDANQIATGTVNDLRLSANVTLQGNSFNGANQLIQTTNLSYYPALNGSLITNLNATALTSGTVDDLRLSNNVALLNGSQTFSGNNIFQIAITVPGVQTINNSHNISLGFSGTASANTSYAFNLSTGSGTQTICTVESGNCAGSGTGVTASGTSSGYVPKFTPNGQTLGDSLVYDDGSNVYIGETSDASPQALNVVGGIQSSTGLYVGGVQVCNSGGCGASSTTAITNGTARQTSANFFIQSSNSADVTGILEGASGQTADILDVQGYNGGTKYLAVSTSGLSVGGNINASGQYQVGGTQISSANLSNDSNLAKLSATQIFTGNETFSGSVTIQPAVDSTNVAVVQNHAGNSNLFIADTLDSRIGIGIQPAYTLDVNGSVNIASGQSYDINGTPICGPSATCAPSSGSNSYVQNGIALQANTNFNIQSTATGSVTGTLQALSSQTADILDIKDNTVNHNIALAVGPTGNAAFKDFSGAGNSTFFQIQGANFTPSLFTANTSTGQILLPNATTSSTALLFGAGGGNNANLYASANGTLKTDNNLTISGNETIGGTSSALVFSGASPVISASSTNTGLTLQANGNGQLNLNTATTGAVSIGNSSAAITLNGNTTINASSGTPLTINGNFGSSPADQSKSFTVSTTLQPAASFNGAYGFTVNSTISPASGTTSNYLDGFFNQAYFGGGGGTITSLTAAESRVAVSGASSNGSITTGYGEYIDSVANQATGTPSVTISTQRGLYVNNQGAGSGTNGLTINNAIGIDVVAQNTAGTSNIGVRIAKANTYSLQLSDTGGTSAGGIEFGTDVDLYRSAASTLKTDGSFTVGSSLTVQGTTFSLGNGSAATISTPSSNAGLTLQVNGSGTLALNTTGAGTVNLGTNNSTTIGIGNASSATTITGNTSSSISLGNFTVSAAGAIVGVGVASGTGLLQGTGGITLTGATNINTSGSNAINIGTGSYSGTIAIGNASATLTLQGGNSSSLNIGSGTITAGTYNGNTFDSSGDLTFGNAGTAYIQPASGQGLYITGHAQSTWSTDSGNLYIYAPYGNTIDLGSTNTSEVDILPGNSDGTGTVKIGSTNVTAITIGNLATNVKVAVSATTSSHGVCRGSTGNAVSTLDTCTSSPGADWAELYPTESNVSQGDLVMPDGRYVTSQDGQYQLPVLNDTQTSYDTGEIGVISQQTLAANGDEGTIAGNNVNASDNPQALALNGRVMTKVDTEGGDIMPGDYITASSTPGVGMKATHAGDVVGRALASYSGSGVSQILIFINPSYYNPDNDLQGDDGNFDLITANGITVNTLTVNGTATFNGSVVVNGHIIGNPDTSGTVTLSAGTSSVVHTFTSSYESAPNVVISPESDTGGLRYWVTKTANDFTVHLSGNTGSDIKFDYFVQQ